MPKDLKPRFGGGIFVYGRHEVPAHGQIPEATPKGEELVICGGPFLAPPVPSAQGEKRREPLAVDVLSLSLSTHHVGMGLAIGSGIARGEDGSPDHTLSRHAWYELSHHV